MLCSNIQKRMYDTTTTLFMITEQKIVYVANRKFILVFFPVYNTENVRRRDNLTQMWLSRNWTDDVYVYDTSVGKFCENLLLCACLY